MKNPFLSFWMAGYECSDQLNRFGDRVDLLNATMHIDQIEKDYCLLEELGMSTVREGVQWSRVESKPYFYDWSQVKIIIQAASQKNVQVLWDLCHFGYPDDLSPLHPHFTKRFTAFALAFVKMYRSFIPDGVLIITPFNEVNFISWLGGEVGGTSPYTHGYGWEAKYNLMEAYIQAVKAMKSMDNELLILTTEPLINIIPDDFNSEDSVKEASRKNEEQYQMLDILCGYICPELGGSLDLVDIVGCNYYSNNQWFYPSEMQADWRNGEEINGYKSLSALGTGVFQRYQRPIVITETSFEGSEEEKGRWIRFVTDQCREMISSGVELWGVCIYPVLNRPDWDFPDRWHNSGIWEVDNKIYIRKIQSIYAYHLKQCIKHLNATEISVF
jgi:beta-glucosidase/6-phospho-beta-glucosidase/beta-galactosidase